MDGYGYDYGMDTGYGMDMGGGGRRKEYVPPQMMDTYVAVDKNMLIGLYFKEDIIECLTYLMEFFGKCTPQAIQMAGTPVDKVALVKYAYKIMRGEIVIETNNEWSQHLKKLAGGAYKIKAGDLKSSVLVEVPRYCVVAGLKDPFSIWNSSQYRGEDRFYAVDHAGEKNIHFKTTKIPVLRRFEKKEIEDVCGVESDNISGEIEAWASKKHCKLVNRYVIVASLRRPDRHLGLFQIICIEGTFVYVYAKQLKRSTKPGLGNGNNRVYDWGIDGNFIQKKLGDAMKNVFIGLKGVRYEYEDPVEDYNEIIDESETEEIDLDESYTDDVI
jgi:hypothetical protein